MSLSNPDDPDDPFVKTAMERFGLVPLRTAAASCPWCGYVCTHIAVPPGTTREQLVGVVCVCAGCATPLRFDASLARVAITRAEYNAMTADDHARMNASCTLARLCPSYRGDAGAWPPAGDG